MWGLGVIFISVLLKQKNEEINYSSDGKTWPFVNFKANVILVISSSDTLYPYCIQWCSFLVKGGAWMGLNDCLFPNKHRWIWGFSKKRCHKFDWYGNEPVYHASGDFNCGAFWETYQYHWHVDSCAQRNYYVCEMKKVWMFYKAAITKTSKLWQKKHFAK